MTSPNLPLLPDHITVPNHIAFSPNGNRRWAAERNMSSLEGHKAGAEAMLRLINAGKSYGVHTMTFWGFSTENWNRSELEVGYLMKLFELLYDHHKAEVVGNKVRVIHLGRKNNLPSSLAQKITEIEAETINNTDHVINIAVDYGGHDEILRAIEKVISDVESGSITKEQLRKIDGWYIPEKIPYYGFKNYLDTKDQPYPYPDIVVRNAGDKRTSGFLPWQSVYAEYVWMDEYFPDLTEEHLHQIIMETAQRERRFGGDSTKY